MIALSLLPEHQLLLQCARAATTPDTAAEIIALIGKDIDWDSILRMAFRHRLTPLVYWQLHATCPEVVPKPVLDQLRELYQANARRNVSLTIHLLKILEVFAVHGVPVISYKGPGLAAANYGNMALRQFDDLDLLVRKIDVSRARDLLISLGYQPCPPLTCAQEAVLPRAYCERLFIRPGDRVCIDLHWATAPSYLSFSIDVERLWTRLERFSLGDMTIPTVSPEDLLLILCEHGAKHAWERLCWIADIAGLIGRAKPLDWPWVLDQARASGSSRMLFLGLALAQDVIGAPVPESLLPKVQADPIVTALAAQVRQQLFLDPTLSVGILTRAIFYLRTMDRWIDRSRYCLAQMLRSTPGDWALLPLPGPLFPLYAVLRPIRLIAKYGRTFLS
jgi:hypothetical protein